MKKLITAIAIGAFAFLGTAATSEARPYGGHGYNAPASTIYVSGYRYGNPVYTEKYVVGYDRYGRPRYAYRTVSAPHRGYGGHHSYSYSRSDYRDYGRGSGRTSRSSGGYRYCR